MRTLNAFIALAVLTVAVPLAAQDPAPQADGSGQVQIPLELYNQLVEQAQGRPDDPRPAPVSYALGRASVSVTVRDPNSRPTAEVAVSLSVRVFEDEWVLVPVLPPATPVESATVNGAAVELVAGPGGLFWSTRQSGTFTVALRYRVDAARSTGGAALALPLPRASALQLDATLPGTGLDVTVIPAAGVRTSESGGTTRVQATLPTTSGAQLAWRLPTDRGHALSRAVYTGSLTGDAVVWSADLEVELLSDETLTLPLLAKSVTLSRVAVDGRTAAILTEGDQFATLVSGSGRHTVTVGFEVPVIRGDGPPSIRLRIPQVPVSRFDLTLPGKKEVTVQPVSNVVHRETGSSTVVRVHVPMTRDVTMTWSEAVPEDQRAEVRANADVYHAVHAEEGALFVRALIDIEITRGEARSLELAVPPAVVVNRIASPSGAVADWRVEPGADDRTATVFFDREVTGSLQVEVAYDRSLAADTGPLELPLLRVLDTHRQRGMVALLRGKDVTLRPVDATAATQVGENQLPAFVRQTLELPVDNTYRYVETPPSITVQATAPERQAGRFDAQVDTLVSLGDVSLKGSASVELDVKSGRILELDLDLPAGVNLLSLTGPSVRRHTVEDDVDGDGDPANDGKRVTVEFTQEMEGQFRLEVAYELLLTEGEELVTPVVAVRGAEVGQGRLAVEALSAVEVQPSRSTGLTPLDIAELPQKLILRTTNPILMAYKYVQAEPEPELALTLTRHRLLEVQEATIDSARYRTLFTRDGLAVTTAEFQVRNSGEQFLRIALPADAEVWSVFVDGRTEKPAEGEDDDDDVKTVLIGLKDSTSGFPVELIYKTPSARIGGFLDSAIRGRLPHPDILVTQTRWDVHVPADVAYQDPIHNMELVDVGVAMSAEELAAAAPGDRAGAQAIEPLHLVVPSSGLRYSFEKLYANQSADEPAEFELPYVSGVGLRVGRGLSLLGTAVFWFGVAALVFHPRLSVSRRGALALVVAGFAVTVFMLEYYHLGAGAPIVLSVVALLGLGLYQGWTVLRRWRSGDDEDDDL